MNNSGKIGDLALCNVRHLGTCGLKCFVLGRSLAENGIA